MPSYLFLCQAAAGEEPAVARTLKAAIEDEGTIRHLWACVGVYGVVALGLFDHSENRDKVLGALTKDGIVGCWLDVNTVPAGEEIDDGHWKGGLESGSI